MKLCCLLLSIALSCCAAGDHRDNTPAAMSIGAAQSPEQAPRPEVSELVGQQEVPWKQDVLDQLKELVQVQKEVAKGQDQVIKLLGVLGNLGSQQIQDLQNLARHQSLLVENHQALLLQTSRISTALQEVLKKPAPPSTGPNQ